MEMTSYDTGVPCWIDLGAPDVEAASAFYSALFGWDIQVGPPEAGGYRMCLLGGAPVAGLGAQMNPGPPVWTTYFATDDAEATAANVTEAGGSTLVPPMDVMGFGRMAVFMDPMGAAFSVWQPQAHAGAGRVNEPGTLCWNELVTTDVAASASFYGAVFGLGSETHGEGPGAYTEFTVNGRSIAGMMLKPPMIPAEVPPHWMVYFAVADADEALTRAIDLGGALVAGPIDIPIGRFVVVSDPGRAVFSMITLAAPMD